MDCSYSRGFTRRTSICYVMGWRSVDGLFLTNNKLLENAYSLGIYSVHDAK